MPVSRDEGDDLLLLHAGHLYGSPGRNALSLVEGLAVAFRAQPAARGQIHLTLLGAGPGGPEAESLAEELGIPDAVSVTAQVPMAEAAKRMDQADVLVLIKHSSVEYDMQVPGKTFQYLGCGKPILGIMLECEAAEIIRRSDLGVVVAPHDVEGIARHLVDLWRQRDELPSIFRPSWPYIRQFSRARMAERVSKILEELVGRAHAGRNKPPG